MGAGGYPLAPDIENRSLFEIVFGANLRSANEKLDLFWVKEAGLMAGRLAKRLGQTEQERKLYQRLAKELPGMPI